MPRIPENSFAYSRDKGQCRILLDAALPLAEYLAAVSNLTKSTKSR